MSESKIAIQYDVCFVQNDSSSDDATSNLKLAFESMDSNQLEPVWITQEECLKFTEKEPKLFVMDPFEGKVFEHLKSIKCRIVGPLCILYCLQYGDVLPKRPHPIYSVSMRKITVSCSNIDNNRREDLCKKIQLMGGFFSKDFTKSVTHLVVGEVGSKKYHVAANFNLPIMIPEWIDDVWLDGQYKQIHASDNCYNKYKCPVFKGLVVTVSQLSTEERNAIQSIVELNGGTYLPPLKAHETTHLVLSEPSGDKYRYAKNWKVHCVTVHWVYQSIEAGYCKDENLFKIENSGKNLQPNRSTPNRDLTYELPPVDCSVINNVSAISHLDETIKSDISVLISNKKGTVCPALETFDLACLPKYGQFLDGCKIYLTGFNQSHLDKLRKIVNAGGGMRFSKYSDSITHVVCSELTNEILKTIKSSSVQPYIVNSDWLLECCKKEQLVDEKPFLCIDVNLLSPEKEPEMKKLPLSSNSSSQLKIELQPPVDNISEIFNQYIPEKSKNDSNFNENQDTKSVKDSKNYEHVKKVNYPDLSVTNDVNNAVEVIDLVDAESIQSTAELFAGLKFIVAGFGDRDAEILARMIESHSGSVLSSNCSIEADIAVVPIIKYDCKLNAANIITNCWLQKCIEDSRIYDFSENDLFFPVEIQVERKPFSSFVISVSQYSGTERDCLMHLAEVMGATCQEYFVRKANKSRGILSNTHLIAVSPEGSKYEAAKKWKIPVVNKNWVLDTAKLGFAPPVDNYLIDNSLASQADVINGICETNETALQNDKTSSDNSSAESKLQINCNEKTLNLKESLPGPSKNLNETKAIFNIPADVKMSPILPKAFARTMSPVFSKNMSTNKIMSPLVTKTENSINESYESLDLNKSYKYKFRVSELLNELDSSNNQDLSSSMKRHSLPVEEVFGKNLASAVRRFNWTMNSESELSNLDCDQSANEKAVKECVDNSKVLKGVVLCVSKKLNNLQHELNEIVDSLGGDYIWTYDSSCTHFVFSGKLNDMCKEFREAKGHEKKIVCPEWVYACKDKNSHIDENLYPHTLKLNLSLTNEISIIKQNDIKNDTEKENRTVDVQEENHKDLSLLEDVVDFNKQLNELLVAAKSAKKRHSRRLVNSVSSSPVTEVNKIQRAVSDSFIKPIHIEENANTDEPDTCSQQSQPYPIVWDDPTGRLEREKIAARAAALNTPKHGNTLTSKEEGTSVLTCEIPLVPDNVKDASPFKKGQIELEISVLPCKTKAKKFMFTNIPEVKKSKFMDIINELGGEVSDQKAFDITATHLILEKPIKNEKLLSSVASGKWILHSNYLIASEEHTCFLPEENFEWGGPCTTELAQNLPASTKKIAYCPFRWRVKLNKEESVRGAFHDWNVVVIAEDKGKHSTYVKILEAGGAEITPYESSNSALDKISHVIIDMKKRSLSQLDLSSFISHSIKCVKPEYLAFYLIEDPSPDVENFIIPEAKELLDGSLSSSKRRCLSMTTRGSKRSKVA